MDVFCDETCAELGGWAPVVSRHASMPMFFTTKVEPRSPLKAPSGPRYLRGVRTGVCDQV